jgi:hypothetical protein
MAIRFRSTPAPTSTRISIMHCLRRWPMRRRSWHSR